MPDISDQEMETLLKHGVAKPTIAQKAAGFGIGAAEAYNPLNIPRSVEVIGRAMMEPNQYTGEYSKGLVPVPTFTNSISANLATAEGKAVMPDLGVKGLISKIPGTKNFIEGIPQGYETAGGLSALVFGGIKGAKNLLKGSTVKQAMKAEESLVRDVKFLTGEPEGPIMDAILNRPEKVQELFKQQKFGVDDLANVAASALEKKGLELKNKVVQFRKLADEDKVRKISTQGFKDDLKKAMESATLDPEVQTSVGTQSTGILDASGNPITKEVQKTTEVGGGQLFNSKDKTKIAELEKMMAPESISPRDALLITDWIDNNTSYEEIKSGNISKAAANAIKKFRATLKTKVRDASGQMKQWANADDEVSTFLTESEGLADKFTGDGRINAVNSLLNPSKDPIKQRFSNALNIGSESGPIENASDDFFNQLAERRAAQGMKSLDVTKVDPIRDQTNRVYQKWIKIGEKSGQAIGSGLGGAIGYKGGPSGAAAGSIMGISPGGFVGRVAIDKFARGMASPERLLKKAMESKVLSQQAKELAKDLSFFQKNFGVEGANIFANAIKAGVPAVNELAIYMDRQ